MSLTPKIFSRAAKISKAIFMGKPNILADVDLNRYFDILKDSSDTLWKMSGSQFNNVFTNSSVYAGADHNLNCNLSWTAFSVVFRGMQFSIDSGTFLQNFSDTGYPSMRIHLVATKTLVDFTADQVMSGVSGSGLPTSLPGANHEVYSGERLAFSIYPAAPTLGANEEVICKIGTIIPLKVNGAVIPRYYSLSNSAYSDRIVNLLGNKFGDDVSLVEMNQYVMDYFLNYLNEPVGIWKGFYGDPAPAAGNFDATGLGIGNFRGWAFPNGNNGLPDWRGRTPIIWDNRQIDPADGANAWSLSNNIMGTKVGAVNKVLTAGNLPPFIDITGNIPTTASGSSGLGGITDGNPDGLSNTTPITMRLNISGGNGTAIDLRQPSFVTGIILRIN